MKINLNLNFDFALEVSEPNEAAINAAIELVGGLEQQLLQELQHLQLQKKDLLQLQQKLQQPTPKTTTTNSKNYNNSSRNENYNNIYNNNYYYAAPPANEDQSDLH